MSIPLALAMVVLITVVVIRRFAGEPLAAKDLLSAPVILIGIGGYQLTQVSGWRVVDVSWLLLGTVTGLACGAARGATTRLFTRQGVQYQRYTWMTLAAWAASLLISVGLSLSGRLLGVNEAMRPIQLSIGVSLLGEALVCGFRLRRRNTRAHTETTAF